MNNLKSFQIFGSARIGHGKIAVTANAVSADGQVLSQSESMPLPETNDPQVILFVAQVRGEDRFDVAVVQKNSAAGGWIDHPDTQALIHRVLIKLQ